MPTIELDNSEFYSRGTDIRGLLSPISRIPNGPTYEMQSSLHRQVIGTHEGSRPSSNYRDWRFATSVRGFWANYFEIWLPIDQAMSRFFLNNAYLTIYQEDHNSSTEILSLHCDPEQSSDEESVSPQYKRGPHLHVTAANQPIPKAHIALTNGHLEATLQDLDSLHDALEWSIHMIRDEILDRV